MSPYTRREILGAAAVSAAALALPRIALSDDNLDAIQAEIVKRHAEGVQRLQEWVKQPSIAAENRGMEEGCTLMMRLAREAGFQSVSRVPTDGQPGVFATLDAGAARSVGLYFMYDVMYMNPPEHAVVWSVDEKSQIHTNSMSFPEGPHQPALPYPFSNRRPTP